MESPARELARRLAENAEAVCRHYLPNGRREGRYWLVGDVRGTPGRSLYLLLSASADARGRAGKWTDAASGEHGDLLDVIAASCGHVDLRETLAEARRFLSMPMPEPTGSPSPRSRKVSMGTPVAARRLAQAVAGIVAHQLAAVGAVQPVAALGRRAMPGMMPGIMMVGTRRRGLLRPLALARGVPCGG